MHMPDKIALWLGGVLQILYRYFPLELNETKQNKERKSDQEKANNENNQKIISACQTFDIQGKKILSASVIVKGNFMSPELLHLIFISCV